MKPAIAPTGQDKITQGNALGQSAPRELKPRRGGIGLACVLALLWCFYTFACADDTPVTKPIRLSDGRVIVSIPAQWTTQEFAQWQTAVLPPHLKGVGIIFTTYFDPKRQEPDTGAALVRKWATQAKASVTEQAGKVYFTTNETYEFEGSKGTIYAYGVSVDRAAVRIQVRMPDRWKTTDEGKRILTEHLPQFIQNMHLDRPRGDKSVNKIKKTTPVKGDVVYSFDAHDVELNAAAAKAQETLNEFRHLFKQAKDTKEFDIKVKVVRGKSVEYMWVNQLKITKDGFGTINNTSPSPEFPKLGDPITVKNADIFDWVYVKNNRAVGGFSIRIIQERVKAKEATK